MPVHQATTNGNAERRALGQRLLFSNFGYDVGGSYGKSVENIIPHVNCEVDFWVRFADRTWESVAAERSGDLCRAWLCALLL